MNRICVLSFWTTVLSSVAFAQNTGLSPLLSKELAGAPKDAWVPVMVLKDPKYAQAGSIMLGLAQVSDIQDGLPYNIGVFQLTGQADDSPSAFRLSAGQMTLSPVCQAPSNVGMPNRCQQLVGVLGASGAELQASYRLGPMQFQSSVSSADAAYAEALNPYLPWPTQSNLVLGQGTERTQTTLKLSTSVDSKYGQFGLGVANTQNSIFGGDDRQVQFNWTNNTFSGSLTAHAIDQRNSTWTGLDLGLSWRTPWRGVFSVGARNVVGKPPALLDRERAAQESIETERVPYVRYEQDL